MEQHVLSWYIILFWNSCYTCSTMRFAFKLSHSQLIGRLLLFLLLMLLLLLVLPFLYGTRQIVVVLLLHFRSSRRINLIWFYLFLHQDRVWLPILTLIHSLDFIWFLFFCFIISNNDVSIQKKKNTRKTNHFIEVKQFIFRAVKYTIIIYSIEWRRMKMRCTGK